jgi:WD40 repeat protein
MLVCLDSICLRKAGEVGSFAWHPSGLYLALEIAGRLELLHWDSAERAMSKVNPGGGRWEAVAWSPDGALLALDRSCTLVWDVHADTVGPTTQQERWIRPDGGDLEAKLTSCNGIRRFESLQRSNFGHRLDEVADIAWSPDDPDMFVTIGGTECPRDIRVWHRAMKT